jgi:hypothetical protein
MSVAVCKLVSAEALVEVAVSRLKVAESLTVSAEVFDVSASLLPRIEKQGLERTRQHFLTIANDVLNGKANLFELDLGATKTFAATRPT